MNQEAKYWGFEDDEELHCSDPDECVEQFLDNAWDPKLTPQANLAALPETIEVCGFVPEVITDASSYAETVLERLLEDLDENYGSPDEYSKPTEAMKKTAQMFCSAIVAEYEVWRCKQITKEVVNVREWITKNLAKEYGLAKA